MERVCFEDASGGQQRVAVSALETFRASLRGDMWLEGDAEYGRARTLWNGMIDRRPGAIVRCAGAADVRAALSFAGEHGLALSVRGGGHNIAGTALRDGGLALDLSRLREVHVHPEAATARVGPGCTWADVDHETQPFGQAVPSGIVSTTGVAGLTLGGGFGWLTRRWGLTCDQLLSADVVTADGRLVRTSREQEPELFWGLRGGGGNFGVVTSFEFRTRSVGPRVLAGMRVYSLEQAREVGNVYRELTAGAPRPLSTLLMMRRAPAAPFLPARLHGAPVAALVVCWTGDSLEQGWRALEPLQRLGEPLADLIGPKPFASHQKMLDAAQPHGRRYYWKSEYLHDVPNGALDAVTSHACRITSPHSSVLLMHLGGAAREVGADESAAGNRDAAYIVNVAGAWDDPAEDDVHQGWVRGCWEAVREFSTGGTYLNFLTEDDGRDDARKRASWDESTYRRLVELKDRYDPFNVFRSNMNIPPSKTAWDLRGS